MCRSWRRSSYKMSAQAERVLEHHNISISWSEFILGLPNWPIRLSLSKKTKKRGEKEGEKASSVWQCSVMLDSKCGLGGCQPKDMGHKFTNPQTHTTRVQWRLSSSRSPNLALLKSSVSTFRSSHHMFSTIMYNLRVVCRSSGKKWENSYIMATVLI